MERMEKITITRRLLTLGLVSVLAFSGCQGKPVSSVDSATDATDTKSSETNTRSLEGKTLEPTPPPVTWTEDDDIDLYNGYIDTYNNMIGRIYDSMDRYFSYVDAEEEFALLDGSRDFYDCYSISDYIISDIEDTYNLAMSKPEKEDLDNAFLDLYPTLTELIECLNEIYDYTDMKSYLDDEFARGKEYHATLWSALENYYDKAEAFEVFLAEAEEAGREENLKKLKDQGLDALYEVTILLDRAQAIQDELYYEGVYDDNILDMDLEKIQPLYDEFVQSVETVLEMSKDEAKLSQGGIPVNSAYWHTFVSSMKDTKVSLTEVLEKVKSGTPLSYSDTLITLPGNCSLASFDEGVSSMINDYNQFINY